MGLVYIIIVAYNAMPWLDKCLGSIDFSKYKVVVVDNNSKDETVEHIRFNYKQIQLFEEKQNLGFGQGNNKGISYAINQGAEHVFLLNQDAYLVDDCLEKLIQFQKQNPEYGILSPIHTNASLTKLDRNFSNYVRYDKNPEFYSDHVLGNELKPVYEIPFVNAAGWLISKTCLMTVGGFDPIFFHYGEDDNYCQRVAYHSFKIGVQPNTFMVHDRAERKVEAIVKYSDQYFKEREQKLKVIYADITKNNQQGINNEIVNLKKKYFRQNLKFRFKHNINYRNELKLLKSIKKDVLKSRSTNKLVDSHYLDLNK